MSKRLRSNLFWLMFVIIGAALLIIGINSISKGLEVVGILFIVLSIGMIVAYNLKVINDSKRRDNVEK